MDVSVKDHSSPDSPQLLADVERAIATGARTLRFSRDLERRYEQDTLQPRRQFLIAVGLSGLLIYNVFLISDWLTVNDMFVYLALGRLCLISPIFIGLLLFTHHARSRWTMEVSASFGTVVAALLPAVMMVYSTSPYRIHYQMGMLLIMVFGTMIQQPPLRYAIASMVGMLVVVLVSTYLAEFGDFLLWQVNTLLFVSTAGLLLMSSYFLERGARMSYLFALRGRLLEVQLMAIARTDPLTQLFNRRYLAEVMASIWDEAAAEPVAFILLDIDHFKSYNDNYGHPQGDVCLKLLSQVIQQTAQAADALAFRFGGEEMLVVMRNADASQARALAEALRAAVTALAVPHPVLGEGRYVTISLGIAAGLAPQTSGEALIASADSALYDAKHAGRDCLRCARLEAE